MVQQLGFRLSERKFSSLGTGDLRVRDPKVKSRGVEKGDPVVADH